MFKVFFIFLIFLIFNKICFAKSNLLFENISITQPEILIKSTNFDVLIYNNYLYLASLSKEKSIDIYSYKINNNKLDLINNKNLYKYEEEDKIITLKIFNYNNCFYITHNEKFQHKINLTCFYNNKIKNIVLGDSEKPFSIYLKNNILNLFYIDLNKNCLINKTINLLNYKIQEKIINTNICDFNLLNDDNKFLILWKTNNDLNKNNLFFSLYNENLLNISPIFIINLKNIINNNIPLISFNNNLIYFVLNYDYNNKFFYYNFNKKDNIIESKKFPVFYNDAILIDYFKFNQYNFILLNKKIEQLSFLDKKSNIEIAIFNEEFDLLFSFLLKANNINNFKYIYYNNSIFLFWIEKSNSDLYLTYSIFKY